MTDLISLTVRQVFVPAAHIPSCRGISTCGTRYDFNTKSSTQVAASCSAED